MTIENSESGDAFLFKYSTMIGLAEQAGMVETAINDFPRLDGHRFEVHRDDELGIRTLIHAESGEPAEKYINGKMRTDRWHLFPRAIGEDLLEASFGAKPSLSKRGELYREIGKYEFEQRARQWGADLNSLKPGKRPDSLDPSVTPSDAKAKSPGFSNPWSNHETWIDPRTGKYNSEATKKQQAIAASLGLASAQSMAASAGSFVGANKPKSTKLISSH
jgi:hypothetical protein